MALTYFKRYRMEFDLVRGRPGEAALPPGYRLVPWDAGLLKAHAEAKYLSFRHEIDANVFPCLGDMDGCLRLMTEISRKQGFLPEATWLLVVDPMTRRGSLAAPRWRADTLPAGGGPLEPVGTIQGIRDRAGLGAVQNLGIVPEHRGQGLGTSLLFAAMAGFRAAGIDRVYLEVTARNEGAIRLYRRLGFVKARTVYKALEVAGVPVSG